MKLKLWTRKPPIYAKVRRLMRLLHLDRQQRRGLIKMRQASATRVSHLSQGQAEELARGLMSMLANQPEQEKINRSK